MSRLWHDLVRRILELICVILVLIPFIGCWTVYYKHQTAIFCDLKCQLAIMVVYTVLYLALCKIYDAFCVSIQRILELIYSQLLAVAMTDGFIYVIICLFSSKLCNIWPGMVAFIAQTVLVCIWSFMAQKFNHMFFSSQKTAIIYDMRQGLEELIRKYGLDKKYDVKQVVQIQECLDHIENLHEMQTVFLSGVHSHERNIVLKYCMMHKIDVFVIPRLGDVIMSGACTVHMLHLPMLRVSAYKASPEYLLMKRIIDIVLSLIALIFLSPVLILTAAAVKLTDGGPVFYKQIRLTKDGKPFRIIKFRSMRVDAEKDGVARLSTGDQDERVTRVGRIIRKARIDELPQLLNILKGDLSICGPRPERPEIAAQYCEEMPEFALRLQAKAGLTGYAQVYGKYNTTPYDKLQMDLMYIAHPSIIEDIKIMLATVKVLFVSGSTEGVAEGKTTAMEPEDDKSNV